MSSKETLFAELDELVGFPKPQPPKPRPAPTHWTLEWPVEGSPAWRMMSPADRWACTQARMPRQRQAAAINSVIERSLAMRAADRAQHRALDPFDYGHWGPPR